MSEDELLLRLGHEDKAVRREAIAALRELLPETRERLLVAVEDPDWKVRASAVAVLDHAEQDAEVEQVLQRAVRDPDARVRGSAFHSLSCGHCKPDGCVSPASVDLLVEGMLGDPSVRVRRKLAGGLMWGQQGRGPGIVEAFRSLLATDPDRVLRDRAATFLSGLEVPREAMPFREWWPAFLRRKEELLAASSPPDLRQIGAS